MGIAFFTGVSGMEAFQRNLDVTAHNVANVNTNGYKKQRAVFQDLLYTRMNIHKNYTAEGQGEAEQGLADLSADRVGHGVRVSGVESIYGASAYTETTYPLDFALKGEGFFAVSRDGAVEYTRNGAFSLSMSGKKNAFLITSDGSQVLDGKGKPIKVSLDEEGQPIVDNLAKEIGVYQFPNAFGLVATDASSFLATASSGEAVATSGKPGEADFELMQGVLEISSVDLGDEVVKVIESQRAFQLNSRVVQTADQLDEIINNLR